MYFYSEHSCTWIIIMFYSDFVLYRSSICPITGAKPPINRLFWVLDWKIWDRDEVDCPLRAQILVSNHNWDDLEYELLEKDKEIVQILDAFFPKRLGYKKSSLFDEYSNQYFSALMTEITQLPSV